MLLDNYIRDCRFGKYLFHNLSSRGFFILQCFKPIKEGDF